jgi:hypothetical protein
LSPDSDSDSPHIHHTSHISHLITHQICRYSHHVFPNTVNDFEISSPEKLLRFLPTANKNSWIYRLRTVFTYVVGYGLIFYVGVS